MRARRTFHIYFLPPCSLDFDHFYRPRKHTHLHTPYILHIYIRRRFLHSVVPITRGGPLGLFFSTFMYVPKGNSSSGASGQALDGGIYRSYALCCIFASPCIGYTTHRRGDMTRFSLAHEGSESEREGAKRDCMQKDRDRSMVLL